MTDGTVPRQKWWKIQWYADEDTPEERALIWKLDLIVVPYAILAYWVKYIDQANLSTSAMPLVSFLFQTCSDLCYVDRQTMHTWRA